MVITASDDASRPCDIYSQDVLGVLRNDPNFVSDGGLDLHLANIPQAQLAYQVEEIHTVLPTNIDNLGITAGEDRCTLVTCTPFGVNTHRLLVQGIRIPYEESEAIAAEQMQSKEVRSTWEEEYLNGIITGISVVILLAILVGTAMFFRRELE